jgi:hypothetical protein
MMKFGNSVVFFCRMCYYILMDKLLKEDFIMDEIFNLYVKKFIRIDIISKVFGFSKKSLSSSLQRRNAAQTRKMYAIGVAITRSTEALNGNIVLPEFFLSEEHEGELYPKLFNFIDSIYMYDRIPVKIIASSFKLSQYYIARRVMKYKLYELAELHEYFECLITYVKLVRKYSFLEDKHGLRAMPKNDLPGWISRTAADMTRKEEDF